MGKEKPGFLTAKAFSNRIKSKGLQKLRWFCQLCQKQCRDENGFKCHMMAESHHRQMLLFDDNRDSVVGEYTRAFMKGFLDILRRQFGGKRTQANVVYQEYIKDKAHTHMNSTKFTTLTGFINCLHKMGLCAVDQTEKGWFIEYVAKDPEAEHKDKKKKRLELSELEEDEHFFELINKKRKLDDDEVGEESINQLSELKKDEDKKITISFNNKSKIDDNINENLKEGTSSEKYSNKNFTSWDNLKVKNVNINSWDEGICKTTKKFKEYTVDSVNTVGRTLTTLQEIKMEQERLKEKNNRKKYWLHEGIVVKLIDTNLPVELQKKIVHVKTVEDRYTAIVKTVDLEGGNKKMKIRQEHVMTVVPKVNEKVLVVNGAYRGYKALILSLDKKHFVADIKLISGIHSGMKLSAVSYDDISKLLEQN